MPKTPESANSNPPGPAASKPDGESTQPGTEKARPPGHLMSERKGQFLIAARKPQELLPMGMAPLQFSVVEQTLRSSPDIDIVDTVGPKNIIGVLADGMGEAPSVLVARMSEQKASILQQQAQGRLIIEHDQPLNLMEATFQQPVMVAGAMLSGGPAFTATVTVLGSDNKPVKDAEVYMFGSLLPASGVTDAQGHVTLSLFGESAQSIRSLYVKPKADYWSFYQAQPDISTDEANIVGLRPLSDWPPLAGFPQQQILGWGQKAMRLDQLPPNYRGQSIKVAVIDSGAANSHDDLRKIRSGFDIVNKKTSPDTWNEDVIAHGSHCAGVIAGADGRGGVRGFAPDAEVHACKLFPGGQVSQLIDALEYCIEKQIDVVNLSLGGAEPSEALEHQIVRAKRAGVACIVAAGNSGGRVQYPASSPNVLAVAAIGRVNEFPPDSYHTQTMTQQLDANGFFSASFSCFGPEIAVCAPGVAITSSVPPNNYAVWDGTSMAAPHIAGLAALVLAHHPDFQSAFKARSAERVERLFQIICLSARRINLGDPGRTGYGMPDVLVALGLQQQISAPASAGIMPQGAVNAMFGGQGLGGQIGSFMAQPRSIGAPFASAYREQAQFTPQAWGGGTPWNQFGQASGGGLGMANVDPGFGQMQPFFMQPQMIGALQGMGYGMPGMRFAPQGW